MVFLKIILLILIIYMQVFLMNEQRKCFLEMEPSPGEDAVKIVKMITKDLNYYINLVGKAAGSERIKYNFEGSSTVGKMLSSSTASCRETVHERESMDTANFIVVLF